MVKNYMIIRTTGKAAYSTTVAVYKITNNTPVLLGELHGQSEDQSIRYVSDVLKQKGSKINVVEAYRKGEINIHEIIL